MQSSATTDYSTPVSLAALAVFIAIVFGGGGMVSGMAVPGPWYAALLKPPFNPPDWVFAPVWLSIYVLIALAGWRIWVAAPHSQAMKFWGAQMLLNWAWTPVFFKAHQLWLATAIVVCLWLAIVGFVAHARRHDGLAPLLFLPYLGWVTFAAYLNVAIAVRN